MLIEKLHPFFGKNLEINDHEEVIFTFTHEFNQMKLKCNEYDELTIIWKQSDLEIMKIQNIVIVDVFILDDNAETCIQFIPEDKTSRMYKIQLKPYIKISYEMYFEVCDGCEEE